MQGCKGKGQVTQIEVLEDLLYHWIHELESWDTQRSVSLL